MSRKILIVVITLVIVIFVSVVYFQSSFFHKGRNWFVDKSETYVKNCESVNIGSSYSEVVEIMGKPDSENRIGNKIDLLYLTGGLKSEAGIGFKFEDAILVSKFCTKEWE